MVQFGNETILGCEAMIRTWRLRFLKWHYEGKMGDGSTITMDTNGDEVFDRELSLKLDRVIKELEEIK